MIPKVKYQHFLSTYPKCPRCGDDWNVVVPKTKSLWFKTKVKDHFSCRSKCGIIVHYNGLGFAPGYGFAIHFIPFAKGIEIEQFIHILPHSLLSREVFRPIPPMILWENEVCRLFWHQSNYIFYHQFNADLPFTISYFKINSLIKSISLLK